MYKTLLKFLIYELVERIARFEMLLGELSTTSKHVSPALVEGLHNRLNNLKQQILDEKSFLNILFSEKTLQDNELKPKLDQLIYGPYNTLNQLSELLNHLLKGNVLPETHLFLNDAVPEEFSGGNSESRTVVLRADGPEDVDLMDWQFEEVLVEQLPLIQKNNPLGWMGLTRSFAQRFYTQHSTMEELRLHLKGELANAESFQELMTHCLSLHLLGPAYYYHAVTEAFLRQDLFFLSCTEKVLFHGLNHLNFTNKTLVFLHEASEKGREILLSETSPTSAHTLALETGLEQTLINEIWKTVEKSIPSKYAFEEKQFQRSVALQERLAQGVLLSGYTHYTLEEIQEEYDKREAEAPIYNILSMVGEEPNSPREIMNAGWVHKLERGPVWLYTTLTGEGMEGFNRLEELLDRLDHLLLKSIETSEIHRVLLCAS